jgi:hypothetical protein
VGFLIAFFLLIGAARAQEFDLRGADLRVVGDATWTGGGWGGYQPIRLEIANFGPGRDLELRFTPYSRGDGIPTVRRRLRVEQNATARVTLSVPLVGGEGGGRVEVLDGGEPVEGLRRDVTLVAPLEGTIPTPSLLAISPDAVDATGFEQAVNAGAQEWEGVGAASAHMFGMRGGPSWEPRHAVVSPVLLPASWIDYSGVDLVAIRLDALAALRPDERAALLDWVEAGGRLIVHRVGATPAESEELRRTLGPDFRDATLWRPADPGERRGIPILLSADGGPIPIPNEGSPTPPLELLQPFLRQGAMIQGRFGAEPRWGVDPPPFFVRRVGFGHVASVKGDVFGGGGADWAWLIRTLGGPAATWPIRYGLSSGSGDIEFINLPIPGVRGVPTLAFLSLISLFAIGIGPANYFLLWRKRRLSRLVLTVPAVAAVTSGVLFGYAAVAHGFGTKGRVRSVTLLDPATNTATSVSRVAVFSGMAPSRGLRFSKETAVFPLLPYGEEFRDGEVDWTEAQGLTAGWLNTRTRTQFVTVTRRDERGRLTVTPKNDGLRAVNGFAVPLKYLVVTGADGRPYFGRNLPAGGEARLESLGDEDWRLVREFADERRPALPDGVSVEDITQGFGGRPWRWRRQGWSTQFKFGLLERHLDRLVGSVPAPVGETRPADAEASDSQPADITAIRLRPAIEADTIHPLARPRGFLAVAAADPGIDLGGLDVEERDSVHVLMGTW